ncbi:RNA polymerase sigma factor [Amycolatopsis sp. NPDC003731]
MRAPVLSAESFETFYCSTAPRVLRAVQRIAAGDHHIAEDATQEAYCHLWKLWLCRESEPLDDNRRYVVGIAAHKVMDVYRRQRRLTELDAELAEAVEDSRIDDVLDELVVLKTVRELIARQPPQRRAVAVLFFLEELNYDEITANLEISKSTVRTHVQRLRAVLKPQLVRLSQIDQGGEGR